MRSLFKSAWALPGVFLISSLSNAFEVEHDSHVHGHATLQIVQEKDELQLVFKSPSMNIVGFEHAPSTAEQRSKIESAEKILKDPSSLFRFNKSAGCTLEHAKVESELLADHGDHHGKDKHDEHHDHGKHDDHHDDHHDHGKHDDHHDDHHDHDKHDDHHDDHHDHHDAHGKHNDHHDEHEHHGEDTHSDFVAEYHYECASVKELSSLNVELFGPFPTLEEVEAQVATSKGQKLVELSAKSNILKF